MNNYIPWFDPKEYSKFLIESPLLGESLNVPLAIQKAENRRELRAFDAQTAKKRGMLKADLARDAAEAKFRGIQRGMGESFRDILTNNFLSELVEDKTPLKAEKRKMRPEVDPKDRDRDRKREERKQKKMEGLGNLLIVKHKGINRIEIIEREDFDPRNHELIKGKTSKMDKGRVTMQDLQRYSARSDFRNTKTSIRVLGKVQDQVEKETEQKQNEAQANGEPAPQQSTPPPPPPPRPRVPTDGKEITDEASTYPDWDHDIGQITKGIPSILNTLKGVEMDGEMQQSLTDSRTLGDSLNRFINGFQDAFPGAASYTYKLLDKPLPTGKYWSKNVGPKAFGTAIFVAEGGETPLGFNIKIGKQIRLTEKGEAGVIFDSVLSKIKPEDMPEFSTLYEDLVNELRKTLTSKTTYVPSVNLGEKSLTSDLMLKKLKQEETNIRQKQFIDELRMMVETFINESDIIKAAYILEALTGSIKFDGELGTAQMLITSNKDGTDTKVIQLDQNYINNLVKSKDTRLNVKFIQGKIKNDSPLNIILQNINGEGTNIQSALIAIDNLKSETSDPKKFMKLMGLQVADITFSIPISLGEYYFEDADSYNTLILNPDSSKEEIVSIPVLRNFTPDGKEQNYIERGSDEEDTLTESYITINDHLVELIKQNLMTIDEATSILNEEFYLIEKRNYRKEYDNYHSKPEQRANRSKRVLARRKVMKKGKVKKGDGKDVHHEDGNPQNNSEDNLKVLPKSKNRSMNEEHGAGFEGTTKLLRKFLKTTPFSGNPLKDVPNVSYSEDIYVDKKTKRIKNG